MIRSPIVLISEGIFMLEVTLNIFDYELDTKMLEFKHLNTAESPGLD